MEKISNLIQHEGKAVTFEDFYAAYPKKVSKVKAEKLWNKLSESKKHLAITDIHDRKERHWQWQDKQYIPAPDVYLRNEKWTDEIIQRRSKEEEQESLEDGSNLGRFWTLLKQTYGDERVKREYGDTMPYLWRKSLDGLTKRQIAKIISYLMTDADDRLPTLQKINRIKRIGSDEYKALPVPKADKNKALDQIEAMKKLLGD